MAWRESNMCVFLIFLLIQCEYWLWYIIYLKLWYEYLNVVVEFKKKMDRGDLFPDTITPGNHCNNYHYISIIVLKRV